MNDRRRPKTDVTSSAPRFCQDGVELLNLFLDSLPQLAHVELVDDPQATVHRPDHDLLTELLCEV